MLHETDKEEPVNKNVTQKRLPDDHLMVFWIAYSIGV